MVKDDRTWVTTFCNHPHRMRDGRPVNHECYHIPPRLLELERDAMSSKGTDAERTAREDACDEAWRVWSSGSVPRNFVKGVPR